MLVIKIGGSLDDTSALVREIATCEEPLVVVHGANRQMDSLATQLGHPPQTVTSERGQVSRYTDAAAMDHLLMAYCGLVNKRIVEQLQRHGRNAMGLSAMDARIAVGRRRERLRIKDGDKVRMLNDDFNGSIEEINAAPLQLFLEAGVLPVLSPPALSRDGYAINVDGDRLAMELAIALQADRLMIFSDTPGFLRDHRDETTVVKTIAVGDIPSHMESAMGRAGVKLTAAGHAVERGVGHVGLVDGRGTEPLAAALQGAGTWITR